MRASSDFEQVNIDPQKGRCAVQRRGSSKILELGGMRLEAELSTEAGFHLLWLIDDVPHDEGLYVYYLDPLDRVVDSLESSALFAAGLLDLVQIGDSWVDFSFYRNALLYRLAVHERSRFRLRPPLGWKYSRRFRRHFLKLESSADE